MKGAVVSGLMALAIIGVLVMAFFSSPGGPTPPPPGPGEEPAHRAEPTSSETGPVSPGKEEFEVRLEAVQVQIRVGEKANFTATLVYTGPSPVTIRYGPPLFQVTAYDEAGRLVDRQPKVWLDEMIVHAMQPLESYDYEFTLTFMQEGKYKVVAYAEFSLSQGDWREQASSPEKEPRRVQAEPVWIEVTGPSISLERVHELIPGHDIEIREGEVIVGKLPKTPEEKEEVNQRAQRFYEKCHDIIDVEQLFKEYPLVMLGPWDGHYLALLKVLDPEDIAKLFYELQEASKVIGEGIIGKDIPIVFAKAMSPTAQ